MKVIKAKCDNCGKPVYVADVCVREKIFCTLGCMDESEHCLDKNRK